MVGSVALAAWAGLAWAQTGPDVHLRGEFEQFFSSSGFGDSIKSRDRFSRLSLAATSGKWELFGSYWYYPHCLWYEMDESGLTYREGDFQATIGRIRVPVGNSTWYDDWYTGFVLVPLAHYTRYQDRYLLERTSVGMEAEDTFGPNTFKLAVTSADSEVNHLIPEKLDRLSGGWWWYGDGLTLGASGYFDTAEWGKQEQLLAADFRYTLPHFTFRGERIWYRGHDQNQDAWFVEASHRPAGWTDLTLVGRFEAANGKQAGNGYHLQSWTLGARLRLPYNVTAQANYTGGPDMNRIFFGGNWALGIYTVIQF